MTAQQAWTRFLHDPEPPEHAVQLYGNVAELARSVSAYLAAGFDLGEPAVVIATPEHWRLFAERLADTGWEPATAHEQGLLSLADAEETLAAFLVDGQPDARRFEQVVGSLLDRIAERHPGRRIRAFGEMVDVLAQRGDREAAAALEQLWNAAAAGRNFALLCAYAADPFERDPQVSLLPDVCSAHTHVLPAADPERFQRAVDSALQEVLGPDAERVTRSIGDAAHDGTVPKGQLALMWVSEHMPARAEVVLAAARRKYGHRPAATG